MNHYKRGEIYLADLEPVQGSEMRKERPCVIVSNNVINENASVIVICPITDMRNKKPTLIHIPVYKGDGELKKDSIVHCGQIRAIDKSRLGQFIGALPEEIMHRISSGISIVVDLFN